MFNCCQWMWTRKEIICHCEFFAALANWFLYKHMTVLLPEFTYNSGPQQGGKEGAFTSPTFPQDAV